MNRINFVVLCAILAAKTVYSEAPIYQNRDQLRPLKITDLGQNKPLETLKNTINEIAICKGCNLTPKQQDELRVLMEKYRKTLGHLCSLTCKFDFINLRPEEHTSRIEKHFKKLAETTKELRAFYKKTGAQPCCKLPTPKEVLNTLKLGDHAALTAEYKK